jgi:hypothetical protein
MNPEYIINSIKQTSEIHYRDGNATDRLSYRVGMLEAKIRELCAFHDSRVKFFQDEIKDLSKLIDNLS